MSSGALQEIDLVQMAKKPFKTKPSTNSGKRGRPQRLKQGPDKENIETALQEPISRRHLNERGRQYEEQRAIEREKHEQRIRNMAATKAAKKKAQGMKNNHVSNAINNSKTTKASKSMRSAIPGDRDEDNEGNIAMEAVMEPEYTEPEDSSTALPPSDDEEQEEEEEDAEYEDAESHEESVDDTNIAHSKWHTPEQFVLRSVTHLATKNAAKSNNYPSKGARTPTMSYLTPHTSSSPAPTQIQPSTNTTQVAGIKRKAIYTPSNLSNSSDPPEDAVSAQNATQAVDVSDAESEKEAMSRPRKRVRDYSGSEKRVLELAQEEFQVRVCTEYAFPEDHNDLDDWITECWENACDRQETPLKLTSEHIKLIRKRTSTIRGRIKDKAVTRVASLYGFRESTTDEDIEYNKQRAVMLLKDLSFIYSDAEACRGMYEHPILQAVINAQFFANKLRSDGVVFSSAFNPVPNVTIALIFTAVQFAITQWAANGVANCTGSFNEEAWHPVYKLHLDGLKKWEGFNDNTAKALARLKQRLFDTGSKRAGCKQALDGGNAFSDEMLARAAAALDN